MTWLKRLAILFAVSLAAILVLDKLFPPPIERGRDVSIMISDRDDRPLRAIPRENGSWRFAANLDNIDPVFIEALLEVEDKRFWTHGGVDWVGMVRAVTSSAQAGRVVSGGSTITMQTARLLEPRPKRIPASTLEAPLWKDSIMYIEQYGDAWHYLFSDRWIEKFCVGAAQLDQYGNANNSVIGADYHAPKVRLPGTAGLSDLCSLGKKLYYWNLNHSPKSLVEKVDFISGAGYLDGHDARDKLGLKNGPQLVVTNRVRWIVTFPNYRGIVAFGF